MWVVQTVSSCGCRCWSHLYSCCVQYHQTGMPALGLLPLPSCLLVIKKQRISVLRRLDYLEASLLDNNLDTGTFERLKSCVCCCFLILKTEGHVYHIHFYVSPQLGIIQHWLTSVTSHRSRTSLPNSEAWQLANHMHSCSLSDILLSSGLIYFIGIHWFLIKCDHVVIQTVLKISHLVHFVLVSILVSTGHYLIPIRLVRKMIFLLQLKNVALMYLITNKIIYIFVIKLS